MAFATGISSFNRAPRVCGEVGGLMGRRGAARFPAPVQLQSFRPRKSIRREAMHARFQRSLLEAPQIVELPHSSSLNKSMLDKLFDPLEQMQKGPRTKRETVIKLDLGKRRNASSSCQPAGSVAFVEPESLPELQSPRRYGIRKFDGNMSETKAEHAQLLVREGRAERKSLHDSIYLSAQSSPRLSRMPTHRSTISTPRDTEDSYLRISRDIAGSSPRAHHGSLSGASSPFTPRSVTHEPGLLSAMTPVSPFSRDQMGGTGASQNFDFDNDDVLSEQSEDSSFHLQPGLSLSHNESSTMDLLQVPLATEGGLTPRKPSLFNSSIKLRRGNTSNFDQTTSVAPEPKMKISRSIIEDSRRIASYKSTTHHASETSSHSSLSVRSRVILSKNKDAAGEHKNRLKKLLKIAEACGMSVNVVQEEVLRYQGENESLRVANFLEKQIRKHAKLASSEVRVQMSRLDKLKRAWLSHKPEPSISDWDSISQASSVASRLSTQ